MRTKFVPVLACATLAFWVMWIGSACNQPQSECPDPPPEKVIDPSDENCCESVDSSFVENKLTFKHDQNILPWEKAVLCPCDSTLALVDIAPWDPEDEDIARLSDPEGEGGKVWGEVVPLMYLPNRRNFGPEFHDQGRTREHPAAPKPLVKVAILDSGLDSLVHVQHRHEIEATMNMFDFTTNVKDMTGHGTAVFAVIDAHAEFRARYYIYKCLDADGRATTFSIACALKCAQAEEVDVINLSVGSYAHSELLRHIVDHDLKDVAIITSRGNKCTTEETQHHFPSNYRHAFGIVGLNADFVHPLGKPAFLWSCTNGSAQAVNLAAPSIITATNKETSQGTSFAAAFATGRFVKYLYEHRGPETHGQPPHVIFRDRFLNDTSAVVLGASNYLKAAGKCVDVTVIK